MPIIQCLISDHLIFIVITSFLQGHCSMCSPCKEQEGYCL